MAKQFNEYSEITRGVELVVVDNEYIDNSNISYISNNEQIQQGIDDFFHTIDEIVGENIISGEVANNLLTISTLAKDTLGIAYQSIASKLKDEKQSYIESVDALDKDIY